MAILRFYRGHIGILRQDTCFSDIDTKLLLILLRSQMISPLKQLDKIGDIFKAAAIASLSYGFSLQQTGAGM